jgi:hypothetical protein
MRTSFEHQNLVTHCEIRAALQCTPEWVPKGKSCPEITGIFHSFLKAHSRDDCIFFYKEHVTPIRISPL